jgi:hypothetical protein
MNATEQPEINPNAVRSLLTHAVAGLDPADRAERMAWCRRHQQHGVTMHTDNNDDLVELRWGGCNRQRGRAVQAQHWHSSRSTC